MHSNTMMVVDGEDFVLTEANFLPYATRFYNNPQCLSYNDFLNDLKHIKYIKRLIKRYLSGGPLRERFILNHIIIFYNVFEGHAATKMLFYKLEDEAHPALKTFLSYLNHMPERVIGARSYPIHDDRLPIDFGIAARLTEL